MSKANTIGIVSFFALLSIALSIGNLQAQESCVVPTFPNVAIYPQGWHSIGVSDVTVDPGGGVDLTLSWGCQPYSWSVTGNGFSLLKSTTASYTEANRLIADSSSCGSATVTELPCPWR